MDYLISAIYKIVLTTLMHIRTKFYMRWKPDKVIFFLMNFLSTICKLKLLCLMYEHRIMLESIHYLWDIWKTNYLIVKYFRTLQVGSHCCKWCYLELHIILKIVFKHFHILQFTYYKYYISHVLVLHKCTFI